MLKYKIFPTIGIARVGNSPSDFFLGPEVPGEIPPLPYRDADDRIKRQGARFRVYEFDVDEFGNEVCTREVVVKRGTRINWHVDLANRKAASGRFPPGGSTATPRNSGFDRQGLIIAGQQDVAGTERSSGPISGEINFVKDGNLKGTAQVELGELKTDAQGRLIVLGGRGLSRSPLGTALTEFANNSGWYDDVSDGPVSATIQIGRREPIAAEPAWVVVAPPAYAPGIFNVVTWYDQARSIEAHFFNPQLLTRTPSFTRDIYPILKRAVLLSWVVPKFQKHHGANGNFLRDRFASLSDKSDDAARMRLFNRLVKPHTPAQTIEKFPASPPNMPKLFSGLSATAPSTFEFASLTELQYSMMEKWALGDFNPDWEGEPALPALEDIPLNRPSDQPENMTQSVALTRAALEGCVGGPFFPGIEATYIIAQPETYEAPYTIDRDFGAGHMTEGMALPWQADYIACGELWWPAQRPVHVKTATGSSADFSRGISSFAGMVEHWSELGFILQSGDEFVETDRKL